MNIQEVLTRIHKCPNIVNVHLSFHEQAVYKRDTKMLKVLLEIVGNNCHTGDTSLLFKEQTLKNAHLYHSKDKDKSSQHKLWDWHVTINRYTPYKVKLASVVEGNQKALFSIATTPRCRRGCYSFPCIASLYSWYISYIAEC